MLRRLLLPLLLLTWTLPAMASEKVLRVCMTDTPHVPWRLPALAGRSLAQGLDHQLIDQFERETGWKVQRQLMASRRCLVELQAGRADATVGLSYSTERAAYLRYPMQGEQPDVALALRHDGYSLYHRAGLAVTWDGQKLGLPPGTVVEIPAGHSVGATLRAAGVAVGERTRHSGELLQMLVRGEVPAVALHTSEAEAQRLEDPKLRELVRLEPALTVKPYFVVFAKPFAEAHEAELPGLWAAFQKASRFPAYQQAARQAARQGTPMR